MSTSPSDIDPKELQTADSFHLRDIDQCFRQDVVITWSLLSSPSSELQHNNKLRFRINFGEKKSYFSYIIAKFRKKDGVIFFRIFVRE